MNSDSADVISVVKLELDAKLLKAIDVALQPESENPSSERSTTSISIDEKQLIITTYASDTTALRASLNSYLRWVEGIQNIVLSI
ncbi:MAG: KEOPS complex subunit Pcc1 [Candidatus Bathyarchaeota archaeon]|nr:KEOPS complex subunit Pcc1 [Candidatus Bathyarchaeota archaeon]